MDYDLRIKYSGLSMEEERNWIDGDKREQNFSLIIPLITLFNIFV